MRRIEPARGEPPALKRKRARTPLQSRYWAKVDRRGPDECWPWIGAKDKKGYGIIGGEGEVKFYRAHRYAYELEYGPIPAGKLVLHRCDCPGCQNPRHLRAGTHKQNAEDAILRNRNARVLSNDDVLSIVRLRFDLKLTFAEIGRRYGVTSTNIGSICKGKTYSWLTGIGLEEPEGKIAA